MGEAVKQAYREVLKLVKRLPPHTRAYYTQYARENFVTYSEVQDAASIQTLLARAHQHTCWILNKVTEPLTRPLRTPCAFTFCHQDEWH
jgi:hypothetical protein